jgi:hypothetical protein
MNWARKDVVVAYPGVCRVFLHVIILPVLSLIRGGLNSCGILTEQEDDSTQAAQPETPRG